jgi:hypothetical protein
MERGGGWFGKMDAQLPRNSSQANRTANAKANSAKMMDASFMVLG